MVGYFWSDFKETAEAGEKSAAAGLLDASDAGPRSPEPDLKSRPGGLPRRDSVVRTAEVETLSGDPANRVGDLAELQLLAGTAGLPLTVEQWNELAALTAHHQAVRQAFEATIARVTRVGPGLCRIEVPAYPSAGDALRGKFAAEVREKFGTALAAEIEARMGTAFEGLFGGFGVGVQTVDFSFEPGSAGRDYQVTRTIRFWNSVEAGSRLTTRTETHFPGVEDPSGHRWGPFLSLMAARAAELTGS